MVNQQGKHLVVLNVVALSPWMLGEDTPNLNRLLESGYKKNHLKEVVPAVTTTSQACMLTGEMPNKHGIVANGWYFKDLAEVMFWKQPNHLVQAEKVWHPLKKRYQNFKVSKLFWWYNMYAEVDASITPRPHYLADGNKIFDLYSSPSGLHESIEKKIGKFPFFNFWGPKAGIGASKWIADCAIEEFKRNRPNLQLVYLPHLDYSLQKFGPESPQAKAEIKAIDAVIGELIHELSSEGAEFILLSEYGITEVSQAVPVNQILRKSGYINVRRTHHMENLDCGASRAFAAVDHQVAHVYIKNSQDIAAVEALLREQPGIESVLNKSQQEALGLAHERSGELLLIAKPNVWFTYYYWLDDANAPEFARTVDIHRKPGYDPCEMFIDPDLKFPLLSVAKRVAKKKLGFRYLMDVIPIKPELIKGSHGRPVDDPEHGPILILPEKLQQKIQGGVTTSYYHMTQIKSLIEAYFS
ncbi:alkaline phosphatase family protein [Gayadomonas joobiniege]|uniref:alkaline phosphatase family protein n=1 Tax=Gayadomonas joobiniege TaxID=1234606 RepID=UPI0003662416|nr:nucleotide pyrophosphatase/phosphodiesterase family protein [Gayadomonas joobiniege]